MTTITICKDKDGSYKGFYCMGHADYAEPGEPDVVCAAVSALTIGTINSLEELTDEKITVTKNEEEAFLRCDIESTLKENSVLLMDAMVHVLEGITEEYGEEYVQIKFEEV
jgi:hypothetical protein